MTEEDKSIARPEHNGTTLREEGNSAVAKEEIHIPDYVMQDFGSPEKTRISGWPELYVISIRARVFLRAATSVALAERAERPMR
jgi:hypothetical protein